MNETDLVPKTEETLEVSMVDHVDISHIDDYSDSLGELKGDLKRNDDFNGVVHRETTSDPVSRKDSIGEGIDLNPESSQGDELNADENINDVFNRIYVKNMIKTCVDKLGTEYEPFVCRKVVSVGASLDVAPEKELKEPDNEEQDMLSEVLKFCVFMSMYAVVLVLGVSECECLCGFIF